MENMCAEDDGISPPPSPPPPPPPPPSRSVMKTTSQSPNRFRSTNATSPIPVSHDKTVELSPSPPPPPPPPPPTKSVNASPLKLGNTVAVPGMTTVSSPAPSADIGFLQVEKKRRGRNEEHDTNDDSSKRLRIDDIEMKQKQNSIKEEETDIEIRKHEQSSKVQQDESTPAAKKDDTQPESQQDKKEVVEEEEEEEEMDLASMNAFEYQKVREYDDVALRRYEQYRRSDLKLPKIRKVLISLNPSLQKVSDQYIIAVKGLAKMFVGDVTEMGLKVKKELGDHGPLQPYHLREAYRRLRVSGCFPSTNQPLISFK